MAGLFCAFIAGWGATVAVVGGRALLTGQSPTTPAPGTLQTPMNAMRISLAMMCGGSLLACWGVSWAIGQVVCDLRGLESYRPKRPLWCMSLAMFVVTAVLIFPPWQLFGAMFWLAGLLLLGVMLCVTPGTWSASVPGTMFVLYIGIGTGPLPYLFSVPISSMFAFVAFGHLFTLRRPRWVDWDRWSAPDGKAQA